MSVILDVPNGDHLPNTHGRDWTLNWRNFLGDFGMAMCSSNAKGPIYKSHHWIASVPSKNHERCSHAIVMRHAFVAFDPSPKRRYRPRVSLLGGDVIHGGTWLEVADASKLHAFVRWQKATNRRGTPNANQQKGT